MTDYFVDLSAASNGTGTSASLWNQVTATELTNVNAGGKSWFSRYSPTVGTKLITWKANTDDINRITYIGWPKLGDF